MARLSARLVLVVLLAGSLGFVGYVSRSDRYPMRDVVVPVSGKQYRVHDAKGFTAFIVFGPDHEAWQREAKGLTPYVARRAGGSGDTAAFALAIRPGIANLFPPSEVGWFRYALREGEWQMVAEARERPRPTPVP
jgi:hypothetical protein